MKVLLDHSSPYLLAHGGYSVLIDRSFAALQALGVEVELMRWWDHGQRADLIHFFAPAQPSYLRQATAKGIPTVLTSLVDWPTNQPRWQWRRRRLIYEIVTRTPGLNSLRQNVPWQVFGLCTRNVVCMRCEKQFLREALAVDPARVDVVSPGLGENFLAAGHGPRDGDHLISTATIAPRKRTVRLARAAREARVSVLFVGRPYSKNDPYWLEFESLIDGEFVRYDGDVADDAGLIERLRHARGFVFMSEVESWCFAASEAVACGLPLLLPPLLWAQERFGAEASYFPGEPADDAPALRAFYDQCPTRPAPAVKLPSWADTGRQLLDVYARALREAGGGQG